MEQSERDNPVVEGAMDRILLILENLVIKFPPVLESGTPFLIESIEGSILKADGVL